MSPKVLPHKYSDSSVQLDILSILSCSSTLLIALQTTTETSRTTSIVTRKMALKDAYTIEAESELERLGSSESPFTDSDGTHVDQRAATASAEHGMEISNEVGQTAVSIGQHVSTPQTFFSRFGRPNPLFESAWPFDFPPPTPFGLEVGVPAWPNLSQDAPHHVPKEQAVGYGDSHDVCRPEHGKIRASTVFACMVDTSVGAQGTPQTSTNNLSPCNHPSEQVQEKILFDFDKPPPSSEHPTRTPERPLSPSNWLSKRGQDFIICDDTPEPVPKKAKLKETVTRPPASSKTLLHPQTKGASKSRLINTKREMNRHVQTGAGRLQKVKTEAVDQEMEDVSYDDQAHNAMQSPSTFGDNTKSYLLNQSSSAATPIDNPASAYANLTRVGKRSNRAVGPNIKQDQGQGQGQGQDLQGMEGGHRRDSRRIDRPFAPPIYARNSGKSKGSRRTELETRKTHYAAEVYEQFANMPNETKDCSRSNEETLRGIQLLVKNCIDAVKQGRDTQEPLTELRDRLQHMQFYDFLSKHLIEKTKVFELSSIGAILLQKNNLFPWDIQADARMVAKQVFKYGCDPHLLRGIKTTTSVEKNRSNGLDEKYPFRTSAIYIGASDLINGEWWPRRICALRDGAHGALEAGIHGETGKGAYSIIVGGDSGYQDLDHSDTLQYCGTSSSKKDGHGASIPTANTRQMLDSCDKIHNQIRVLRAAAPSGKHSAYKPSCGLRFDGMYVITGKEHLHVDTSMYRFTLVRCPGQDPIRYKGPEERPSQYEKREYAVMFG